MESDYHAHTDRIRCAGDDVTGTSLARTAWKASSGEHGTRTDYQIRAVEASSKWRNARTSSEVASATVTAPNVAHRMEVIEPDFSPNGRRRRKPGPTSEQDLRQASGSTILSDDQPPYHQDTILALGCNYPLQDHVY